MQQHSQATWGEEICMLGLFISSVRTLNMSFCSEAWEEKQQDPSLLGLRNHVWIWRFDAEPVWHRPPAGPGSARQRLQPQGHAGAAVQVREVWKPLPSSFASFRWATSCCRSPPWSSWLRSGPGCSASQTSIFSSVLSCSCGSAAAPSASGRSPGCASSTALGF